MAYRIEHVGIIVSEPLAMAQWYCDVLGFTIRLKGETPGKTVAFVTDAPGTTMLELCESPGVESLSGRTNHQLQLHLALESDDPHADADALAAKGAEVIEKNEFPDGGGFMAMVRDPWGHCIQLVKRTKAI